jgi:hypothetical protein
MVHGMVPREEDLKIYRWWYMRWYLATEYIRMLIHVLSLSYLLLILYYHLDILLVFYLYYFNKYTYLVDPGVTLSSQYLLQVFYHPSLRLPSS